MSEKNGGESKTAVIFRSNGELFAFPIESLIEINSRSEFTKVPKLPDYIVGVINLMGDVIPVIDLRRRLGFEDCEYTSRSCLMVITSEKNTAAVRVDEVLTSVRYGEDNFMELPGDISLVSGYITDKDGSRISLINAEKIFSH